MYLSSVRPRAAGLGRAIGPNVWALGLVSLVTDVSAEMVTAVLPAYLVIGLSLSVAQYGLMDGLYTGVTALTRLLGGYTADRWRARKYIAGAGYGLSAVAKLGLLAAGGSALGIGAAIAADRIGKGVRTAPRDALITASADPAALGRAFGLHRTLDSVGAFIGPLVALGVLAATGQAFDSVLVTSLCVAVLGVVLLGLFVRDDRSAADQPAAPPREMLGLLRDRRFRRLTYAAVLLGLVTVGDGFVYLIVQRWQDLPVVWFPLLAVGTNIAFLVFATPLGILADRFGRWRVVIGGHVALLAVYGLLAFQRGGLAVVIVILALYGAFYAAVDGVLMAAAGPLLPASLRTTGLALLQTGQALAYLLSSVAFGLVWQFSSAGLACALAAAGVLVALPLAVWWLRTSE
ncbi:MFS transporter [Fodinicola acaciae]|uniref:MFS transporter n=1 Tax=Fodinicola acaciae TaxID=2681555 RepID=UPI0013D26192|nr:MFS transporter [Fodinicola acaciae]